MRLPGQAIVAMTAHAETCLPEECCGLLAFDRSGRIAFTYPLTNADRSPTSFTVEPSEHFAAIRHAERHGWQIEGVFHSHPNTPPVPSPTDIERWPDPDWLSVLIGFDRRGGTVIRSFRLIGGHAREV